MTENGPGQLKLTDEELMRLPLGNQYTDRRHKPIMCWQRIKAVAAEYDVHDWASKVDPSLTYEENIDMMRKLGCSEESGFGATIKELRAREAIRTGASESMNK